MTCFGWWPEDNLRLSRATLVCFAGLPGLHRLRYLTHKEMMQCKHIIFLRRVPGEKVLIG